MALQIFQLGLALASAYLFFPKSESDVVPTTGGPKSPGSFEALRPGALQADPAAWARQHKGDSLAEPSAELKRYALLPAWRGEWLDYWSKQMGLKTPLPSTLRDKYNLPDGATPWWSYGRGGYVFALARGLVLGPKGADKAGEHGLPKAWAQDFVFALEAMGPSPATNPELKFSWGPIYGLTEKGALRAEKLGFRPSKWPWIPRNGHPIPLQQVLNGDQAAEYAAGHAGFEVSKGVLDFISSLGGIFAIVGGLAKGGLSIGEKAAHYDKDLSDLPAADPDGLITAWGAAQIWAAGGYDPSSKGSTATDQAIVDAQEGVESFGSKVYSGKAGGGRAKDNTDLLGA
mgnify:CR=1 FL=1